MSQGKALRPDLVEDEESVESTGGAIPLPECKELMLAVFASAIRPHSAIYCSAPITSGRRFVDWLDRRGSNASSIDDVHVLERETYVAEVIDPNRTHAQEVTEWLRHRTNRQVIDPTAVPPVAGWRQQDWLVFWEEVIALYASEVVFVDGWEYSNGCGHEFWFAHTRGLPTYDEHHQPVTASEGAQMIGRAVVEIRRRGGPVARLESVLEAVGRLS